VRKGVLKVRNKIYTKKSLFTKEVSPTLFCEDVRQSDTLLLRSESPEFGNECTRPLDITSPLVVSARGIEVG